MKKVNMEQLTKEIGEILKQFTFGEILEPIFRKLLLYPTELRGLGNLGRYRVYSFLTIHHQSQVHIT